jgi:monovalent cation:H+ antiporter-2, CPA2 family
MALISGLFQLSAALGAFFAGILLSAAKETKWVHEALNPFRVFFVALFFIYVGIIIDLNFLMNNWVIISGLVIIVFLINTFINALILFMLNNTWRDSLYAGAMLGPIGEFSFLLVAIGLSSGLIGMFEYQMTVQIIALTLVLSPAWILFNKRVICHIDRFNRSKSKGIC